MGKHTTYSFLDLGGVIVHPLQGDAFQFTGEGIGQVTVAMLTERTVHDVAADGSIMVSKLAGNNGRITIECQITSPAHKYLMNLYNNVIVAGSEQWAMMTLVLRNVVVGTGHIATGVSFEKVPDINYQAQGQKVSWTLLAADIVGLTT